MSKKTILISFLLISLVAGFANAELRAWYKLDETSGTAVADSSGNGFDAVIGGTTSPKWDTTGAIDGCLQETGQWSKMYIDVPAGVFTTMSTEATFAFWAQLTPTTTGGGFFTGNNTNGDQMIKAIPYPAEDDFYIVYRAGGVTTNWWWDYSDFSPTGEWHHLAVAYSEAMGGKGLFFDGKLVQSAALEEGDSMANIDILKLFCRSATSTEAWDCLKGKMDDVRIYDELLSESEIIALGNGYFEIAKGPSPADNATIALDSVNDLDTIALEWNPGLLAASHDVYLGTNFDDVNNATNASAEFMGNQLETTYAPNIVSNGTYFWRIDEVNDTNTWKGNIWSFTVNVARIDDPIAWYKFDETSGTNVADSSGNGFDTVVSGAGTTPEWDTEGAIDGCLQETGQWTAMRIDVPSDVFSTIDTHATFAFWAQLTPTSTGGAFFTGNNTSGDQMVKVLPYPHKDEVTGEIDDWYIVYRAGSTTTKWWWSYGDVAFEGEWHHMALVYDESVGEKKFYFDGDPVHDSGIETTDSIANIGAFKIFTRTAGETQQAWDCFKGKMDDFRVYNRALMEKEINMFVGNRFKSARQPAPVDGEEDLALQATILEWTAGKDAVSHQVYFSDDRIEVKNADVNSPCYKGEQGGTTYDPGTLELSKTYYWRIDEVDDQGTLWKGDLWNFSTIPCIIVEDFESYDEDGNDVTAVWADVDTSGAGDMQRFLAVDPAYPAFSLVNSLRLRYRLTAWGDLVYYAKTSRSFSPTQDWTANGVKILTLNYYGDSGNFGLPMFVTVGDGTTEASVYVDANTLAESWNEANVSLLELAAAGVDLTNVTYMEIGFGDGTNLGSSSSQYDMVYIDDIALYPPKCVVSESALQGDVTQDCVVNYDDLEEVAFNWLAAGYTVSAQPVSDDDLVLHYDFENNTVDSVAGNNGTLQNLGSAATYDTGHDGSGKCIHFNATASDSGSNMIVPPAAFADVNEEITFSFWLKNDTAAPAWYQNTFGGTDEAGQRDHLFMHYSPAYMSNMVSVFHAGSGGSDGWHQWDAISLTQPDTFDYTAWNHIALVKNCFNGQMWMYTNGQLSAYERGETNKMYGCDKFRIGSLYTDNACYQGCFDDFRVYNRALSHAEILTLAGQTSATVAVSELGAEDSDVNDDDVIDFKDYSVLAGEWLVEDLWP